VAYLIENITGIDPQDGKTYLFDTNIWLAVLEAYYNEHKYRNYINFFDKIVNGVPAPNSRIALTAVLLSEIINRILRDIYYHEYLNDNGLEKDTSPYKTTYRKSAQYPIDVENICANIRAFHSKIDFISDNLNIYSCKKLIKNIPPNLDFNDHIITKICKDQGLILVTNDSDFTIEDLHIITGVHSLLAL
jgi:predicted nucleic acid-binding protein